MLECCGEEHGDGGVEEGDATAYFAGKWVQVRGGSATFPASVRTVCAGVEPWNWMAKSEGSDALEFWVGEVQGMVFCGCAVDGTIASATCGKEARLLVFGKVKPDCFGLEVVEDVGESALEGFYLVGEGLLEVE